MPELPGESEPAVSIDFLRTYLAGRDVACPSCQYNLRDLMGATCPECGQQITLRVGLVEPRQRLLITGLIFLSAGAGFNGLFLMVLAILAMHHPTGGGDAPFLEMIVTGLVVESAAMWVWLRNWSRIRRQPLSTRSILVMLCAALTLLNIIIFSLKL